MEKLQIIDINIILNLKTSDSWHIYKIIHFYIQESFNTNISHQLFDYKIIFVNSQLENANSNGDFVLKNKFETFALKISVIQK